jgi:hypothetical protein
VIPELSSRELSEFKGNIIIVNKVRRQLNVREIPKEELFTEYYKGNVTKLLPVGRIYSYSDDLSWKDKIRVHRDQIGLIIAEMQAIDILNGIPTDVTTPRKCEELKENVKFVNINRSEASADQFNI